MALVFRADVLVLESFLGVGLSSSSFYGCLETKDTAGYDCPKLSMGLVWEGYFMANIAKSSVKCWFKTVKWSIVQCSLEYNIALSFAVYSLAGYLFG